MADPEPSGRLDSWKSIADYLQRDVATVRRWEKSLGLPVRRVGRGHSVFAYVSEIDAWLKTHATNGTAGESAPAAERPSEPPPEPTPVRHMLQRWPPVLLTGAVVVVAMLAWRFQMSAAGEGLSAVAATDGIALVGADGVERWRYRMPRDERAVFPHRQPEIVRTGRDLAIVGAVSERLLGGDVHAEGKLLRLTSRGRLEREFSFEDRVTFASETYGGPWLVSDFRVDPRDGQRLAVVGRHNVWWPSLITVLDGGWRRRGTFVHAGWVEWVDWASPDRLLIAGFSNARDGGMVALLDANALDGQAPVDADSPFRCPRCGDGAPLRYVVFPRSEVNRASDAPFNRVTLERVGSGIIAHTLEVPIDTTMRNADAVYELKDDLSVTRASYSDRYWELHRALEREGKITHAREQCPDREGPPTVDIWEPRTGWRAAAVRH